MSRKCRSDHSADTNGKFVPSNGSLKFIFSAPFMGACLQRADVAGATAYLRAIPTSIAAAALPPRVGCLLADSNR
jgi:hypothetical protein